MNNKKVAIVTLVGQNYGNRLQNYALQQVLKRYVGTVRTLPIYNEPIRKQRIKYLLTKIGKRLGVCSNSISSWDDFYFLIDWESKCSEAVDISKYDYFIAGSDQIWNPWFPYTGEREFLTFANQSQRITYAASIGVDDIPADKMEFYKTLLCGIPMISVREEKAAQIIHKLTGRNVPVVLDPTLLLRSNEWGMVADKSKVTLPKPYIFTYFLGKKSDKTEQHIREIQASLGLDVFDIMDHFDSCGPIEFIDLIRRSSYVVTDSFHCTVFSLIFRKEFLTYERAVSSGVGQMVSRLNSLLGKTGLLDHLVGFNVETYPHPAPVDWPHVDEVLTHDISHSLQYIENALSTRREHA